MTERLEPEALRTELKKVIDPEIYQNIVDLGLVYDVAVRPEDRVVVTMTLTTPQCPMGPEILENVENTLTDAGAQSVDIDLVWEPKWTPDMMTDELKTELGIEEESGLASTQETTTGEQMTSPPPLPEEKPPKPKKKGLLARLFGW